MAKSFLRNPDTSSPGRTCVPALLLAVAAPIACNQSDGPPAQPTEQATLVIEGVSVIPMDTERILPDMTVLIGGGRVLAVQPSTEAEDAAIPADATRVDGRGRFLIPGLNDMHVHFQEEQVLGRFLATGVTGIRVLWGGPTTLDFRDRIVSGELDGPDIHTAGTIIEGLPPPELAAVIDTAGRVLVYDSIDGAAAVREQHAAGYDFIKVYNNVPASAYRGIVAEAAALGIPVAGHVPFEVGLDGALAAGQHSIEHLRGYMDRLVDAYLATEEASHMTEGMRTFYTQRMSIPWMSNFNADDFEAAMDGFAVADSLIRALVGVGAPVMAGTDTPPLGFALHRELEELVAAGLSPFEALQSATVLPARFLERGEGAGMVTEGSPADLLLLEGDPLAAIGNTRRIAGVVRRGEWLDRSTLDAMLQEAAGR